MARKTQRLSVKAIEHKKEPGYYADGDGLYLQVSLAGTKSWIFRYTIVGKAREMGLGSLRAVSLSEARDKAKKYRGLLADHIDPIEYRNEERRREVAEAAKSKTFEFCVTGYIKAHRAEWKSPRSEQAWHNTLMTYCAPVFKNAPVSLIGTPEILQALEPIWQTKHETATRVRARLERILDWAKVRGYRSGENPARWEGHLREVLAHLPKVARVKHFPALGYRDISDFMPKLREQDSTPARALEFMILTATRTAMVRFATPEEFNDDVTVWTIPGERMKGRKGVPPDHVVPLPHRAAEIIKTQFKHAAGCPFVFPGEEDQRKSMNANAMSDLAKDMGYKGIATPHGFRATFRTWVDEMMPNLAGPVAEVALAHKLGGGDETQAAYRRGELLEKRRRLMNAWAKHCNSQQTRGEVVPLRKQA